ncbi:unnamed protein product [Periconia digitata]|uniref:Protein kinase domain-containing protein n=1 Tax=Periconia digitata TaxID=1303443 RepID=A0A9W4XQF2_9PLEO|nr:unnamed protein product [Periconia digitata]
MDSAHGADELWESRIAAALATPEGEPLTEQRLQTISNSLRSSGRDSWSRIPRVYATLRAIDELALIENFIEYEMSDAGFPFTHGTLPSFLRRQETRNKFIDAQSMVLTKGLHLEKEGSRHKHFASPEDIPLKKLAELGVGGYGFVEKVISTISHKEYARKLLPRGINFRKDKTALREFENELAHMKKVSHRHIVQLVGSYTDPRCVAILISPVADCDLEEYLRTPMTDNKRSLLATSFGCLTSAINYLHQIKIRHKDIKPRNILVKDHHVYVTDFGISLDWADNSRSTTTGFTVKTIKYCAPEVVDNLPRNSTSDIWSLGCIFLEIWSILSGETIATLSSYFDTHGSHSQNYCKNNEAIDSWCEFLRKKPGDEELKAPGEWIPWMMKKNKQDRWNAQELFDTIQESSLAPDRNYRISYMGSCCRYEDDTAESVQSSDHNSYLELDPMTVKKDLESLEPDPLTKESLQETSGSTQAIFEDANTSASVEIDSESRDDLSDSTHEYLDAEEEISTEGSGDAVLLGADSKVATKSDGNEPRFNHDPDIEILQPSFMYKAFDFVRGYVAGNAAPVPIVDKEAQPDLPADTTHGLHRAASTGKTRIIEILVDRGVDVNVRCKDLKTAVIYAAEAGQVKAVELLIMRGADVSIRGSNDYTALHMASYFGHLKVVELLILNGVDRSIVSGKQTTPLHLAARKRHVQVSELLLTIEGADASVPDEIGRTPLHMASVNNDIEVAGMLIANGAQVSATTDAGDTPLHTASYRDSPHVAKLLLDNGAQSSAIDYRGYTPLFLASGGGNLAIVELLISCGADPSKAKRGKKSQPLIYAAKNGHIDVVNLLLLRGAVIDVKSECGETPLLIASAFNQLSTVENLIVKGAKVNTADNWNRTALYFAAENGHVEIVKLLLRHRADITIVSWKQKTCLDVAKDNNHAEILQLLEDQLSRSKKIKIMGKTILSSAMRQ